MRSRAFATTVVAALAAVGVAASAAAADGGPTMPLSQVQPGMNCTGETVVQGTTISSFNVQVMDIVDQLGEGARILVSVSGPAVAQSGIAEGFSGSPVFCPASDGTMENIGAISETVGQYGNNVGLVTPIGQMLGEPVKPPTSAPRVRLRTRQMLGPLTVSGLSPTLLSLLQRAGERAGRQIVAAPAGPPDLTYPPQPLVPGASAAVSYSSGVISTGAIGTVTYRNGNDVYLFGHELDGAGARSLMLQDAYVYGVISNPDPTLEPSYKLAAPGHTLGTVTSDTPNAVIGEVGAGPNQIPVNVTARDLDTGNVVNEQTQIADETGVGFPLGSSLLDLVAPLAVGQAAIDVFNGPPANESGAMCLRISLREGDTALRFCNRYVGTGAPGDGALAPPEVASGAMNDITNALSLLDNVQFANLHVTGISADITARRGLSEATILSAHAPVIVKPGARVRVRLTVQLFRAAKRTIYVRIKIPRHAHGIVPVTINGAAPLQLGTAGLLNSLGGSLGISIGLFGPQPKAPETLPALKKAFAALPGYDGIEVRLGHSKARKAYRNPTLLVTGSAHLLFIVRPIGAVPGSPRKKR